jgi:hypothetical protein
VVFVVFVVGRVFAVWKSDWYSEMAGEVRHSMPGAEKVSRLAKMELAGVQMYQ